MADTTKFSDAEAARMREVDDAILTRFTGAAAALPFYVIRYVRNDVVPSIGDPELKAALRRLTKAGKLRRACAYLAPRKYWELAPESQEG